MIAKIEDKNRRTEQIKKQKKSFWVAKGLVLQAKRTRFEVQKDPF